jgi:outer membrane protein assembly factor BamB
MDDRLIPRTMDHAGPEAAAPQGSGLSRRSALLLPLLAPALAGCSWFDWLTDEAKKPISGKREPVLASVRGLTVDSAESVTLPPAVHNPAWPQYYDSVSHAGGNLAGGLTRVWSTSIGVGGDYRARLTAQPVVSGSQVVTMDSDGAVAAFDLGTGKRLWRTVTKPKKAKNSNLGGGIAILGDRIYVVTGRAQALALALSDGHEIWRVDLTSPARGAPTATQEGLFFCTMEEQLQGISLQDGKLHWAYQATGTNTGTIGQAAPAYADGVLVAGFESGDLAAVRADSGTLVWTDNMGGVKGAASLSDFASVRGAPVISNGLVVAIGLGGLLAALDVRSGRRVWQRDVAGANTPWLAGDIAYLVSQDQKLAAVGRDDGGVRWVTNLPRFGNVKREKNLITWAGPVLAGGKLVLVSDHGKMAVLDPISGTLVASSAIADKGSMPPTIAQGKVLVLTDDATLTAYG